MSSHPDKSAQNLAGKASGMAYIREAARRIEALLEGQEEAFALAADAVRICIANDGRVFLFGTGHSHMLAEEGHFRAGGLACVVPILSSAVMLHESATAGSHLERLSGVAKFLLSRYKLSRATSSSSFPPAASTPRRSRLRRPREPPARRSSQ